MFDVVAYHRPTTLPDALRLLAADDRVALAGGVHLRHDPSGPRVELVDLQAARLDAIDGDGATLTVGATVRLQALADDVRVPELVRYAATAEQPSTLRSLATVGGAVATAFDDSLLLAALLVHDAVVRVASHHGGDRSITLAELLASGLTPRELIVDVTVATTGAGSMARTGRTPRDRPIVGVVGRRVPGSEGDVIALAACGLGTTPQLVEPDAVASLQAIDDHRATASYRLHLAEVSAARVLKDLA